MSAHTPRETAAAPSLQLSSLFAFLIVALATLTGFRLASLVGFGDWQTLAMRRDEIAALLFLGLRFDLKVLSISAFALYSLPALALGWRIAPGGFRRWLRVSFMTLLILFALLGCIDIGYRIFFGAPIDVQIFGFIEDDTLAVISTLITDLRLVSLYALFALLVALLVAAYRRIERLPLPATAGRRRFFALQALIALVFLILGRGSFDTFPLRTANASVSNDAFINSLILNSPYNLFEAFEERRHSALRQKPAEILKEAQAPDVATLLRRAGYRDQDDLLAVTTPKPGRAPHVVMVQMEGWSTEITLGHGPGNQVLGEFARHIGADHFYRLFFSNAYGTNPTVEALLMNSPLTPLSQSPARSCAFSLSNALPFKRAGYRTLFISGGDSAWRNHERFWTRQGFDAYIGRATIEKTYHVDASDNPWGVYDEYVFRAVADALVQAEKDGVALFVYVMTTNNHSPIRLPASYRAPPLDPAVYGFRPDDEKKRTDLTGFHYQTDQLGKFLSWIKDGPLRERVIVAASGDHILKGFTDYSRPERTYLRYSVPAYFYVPAALDRLAGVPADIVGSHADIFPTLFELALSQARYYRFGVPLMEKSPQRAYGWLEARVFLFPEGVARSDAPGLLPWADDRHLDPRPQPLEPWQAEAIAREKHRKRLKEWLLLNEYEACRKARAPLTPSPSLQAGGAS